VKVHDDLESFTTSIKPDRLWALSTHGKSKSYIEAKFHNGDALLFGPETRGLPKQLLDTLTEQQVLRLPMVEHSRSLNLSNAVAVVVYEAWRQNGFVDAV
jgi:tRNA (cytidine/uridine-2'-O-)-methyltransferase